MSYIRYLRTSVCVAIRNCENMLKKSINMIKDASLSLSWPTPFVMEGSLYIMTLIILCNPLLTAPKLIGKDSETHIHECPSNSESIQASINHSLSWMCWWWTLLLFVLMLSNFYHHYHEMKSKSTNRRTTSDTDGIWMGMSLLPLMVLSLMPMIDDISNDMVIVTSCVFNILYNFQKSGQKFYLYLLIFWAIVSTAKIFHADSGFYFSPQLSFYEASSKSSYPIQTKQSRINIIYYILWLGGTFWYYKYYHNPQTKNKARPRPVMTFGEWNTLWSSWSWVTSYWITNNLLQIPQHRTDMLPILKEKHTFPNSRTCIFLVIQASMVGCGFGAILFGIMIQFTSNIFSRNKFLFSSNGTGTRRIFLQSLLIFQFGISMILILWLTVTKTLTNKNYHSFFSSEQLPNNFFYHFYKKDGYPYLSLLPCIWMYSFLTNKHITGTDNTTTTPYIASIFLYWLFILLCFVLPVSMKMMIPNNDQNNKGGKSGISNTKTTVKRKFYHLVAVILFGPPTYLSPKLMSLSYAAAIVLLVLLESIRMIHMLTDFPTNNNTHRNSCKEKENKFWNFYHALLDKDKDNEHTVIISHMLLILGCAIPLWLQQLLILQHDTLTEHPNNLNLKTGMLPYCGILVLGIGDALGACVGTYYGKHSWFAPSVKWKRTLEGSLAMFLSMKLSLAAFLWFDDNAKWYYDISYVSLFMLLPLTLFEACTVQIDNLCLPLIATCTVYIQTVYST